VLFGLTTTKLNKLYYYYYRLRPLFNATGPYANHLHLAAKRQPRQHHITQFFTGQMLFLTPSQQRQNKKLSRNKITKFDKLYYTAKCKNVLATRKRRANYPYKPLLLIDIQQSLQAQFSHWSLIYKYQQQSSLDKELTSSKPAMMSRNRRRPCLQCLMSHSCTVATDAKHTMTRLYDCPYSS